MLDLDARISAFEILGKFIAQKEKPAKDENLAKLNKFFFEEFKTVKQQTPTFNPWFTPDNIEHALEQWSLALQPQSIKQWVNRYPKDHFENNGSKTITIIMAGNIPLVGFHDFLTTLLSGHKVLAKPSTDDDRLLPFIAQLLIAINKEFVNRIELAVGKVQNFDAVIATGSNNSARYFEHYFSKYPNVIRKNRSSVAVLNGNETEEQLTALGSDIFQYFGLGCRNVSKLYLPKGFDTDLIFKALYPFNQIINHNKYANNFDYNRALFLLEQIDFLENGFMILRENESLHPPAAVLHFEYYENIESITETLHNQKDELQCVVSSISEIEGALAFGESQKPQLWDYADNVDTVKFLRCV